MLSLFSCAEKGEKEMEELFTEEKIIQLKEAREKAMEDTTPFPVMKDGDLAVVGDANKTEVKKHDFVLRFIIPDENGEYKPVDIKYEDVWVKPRHSVTVQRLMTALQPLFYKVQENGKISEMSSDEMLEVVRLYEQNVIDQIYRLVAVVLGVNDELVDFIEPASVIKAFNKIMLLFPDMVKASDGFFGLSSSKKTKNPSKEG